MGTGNDERYSTLIDWLGRTDSGPGDSYSGSKTAELAVANGHATYDEQGNLRLTDTGRRWWHRHVA